MDLYKSDLMEHYRFPRNRGVIDKPDFSIENLNPSCGDLVSLYGKIESGRLIIVKFMGKGCVISQSSASMLTENILGKNIEQLSLLDNKYMLELVGIQLGPNRLRCALLVLEALHMGLLNYSNNRK